MDIDTFMQDEQMKRFPFARIVEHWVLVLIFGVLVCTGLSQKFYSLDVSQWLILHLGGIDNVRLIHRIAGVLASLGVITHLAIAAIGIVYLKWQPTMVISKKDFTDVVQNIRYYLGVEQSPARGGRYTYKQKFEYWGILTGMLLMMFTGIILWFPLTMTAFLPGEIIPAAKVLHANEAFVVFLIIAIWHIYNAIFSPDVFPLDTSILTGYLSKERMLREHPDELAEMEEKPRKRTRATF
ncbi:MAG TPA: cytochrome b/b6 domain-containing protein [Nitrospirota bacterium]|nr:cytochrome b/b6 domain-containing protein [Nitrospirota bacterium]